MLIYKVLIIGSLSYFRFYTCNDESVAFVYLLMEFGYMRRRIQARLAFGDRDLLPVDEEIHYRKDELLLSFLDSIASITPSTAAECVIWKVTDIDRIIAYISLNIISRKWAT